MFGQALAKDSFSHSALGIKTYAMARLRTAYRESTKGKMPRRCSTGCRIHNALDDVIEQGVIFCHMLSEILGNMST